MSVPTVRCPEEGKTMVETDLAKALLAGVDQRADDLVALLRDLVSCRSENPKLLTDPDGVLEATAEESRCQNTIAEVLSELDLEVDRFEALPGRDDLVGTWRGERAGRPQGRSLILNGHVDVVPAGDLAAWSHDPWAATVADGKVFGRGSCDMKAGLAAGLTALFVMRDLGLKPAGDLVFQAVVDEETGGPGTREALKRHRADAAIVLEPTAGAIMPVEGGLEWLTVTVQGRPGHSALRYRSVHAGGRGSAVNAIEKAVKLLAAIQELERQWGNQKVHPLLPHGITTINPGSIEGGSRALSTMAEQCVIGLSLKYLPSEDVVEVKREFEEYLLAIANADPWLREHPPTIEWSVSGVSFPPSEISTEHPLAETVATAFESVVGEPQWRGFEAVSDIAWMAEAGVPALLYGPGDAAQAHATDEFVEIEDAVRAAKVVALATVDWCAAA